MKNKQEHILETALILFASEGISVPTAKVAKESGVANGTLFNYYPTKQALIDAVFLSIKNEQAQILIAVGADKAKSLKEGTFIFWDSYVRWALENPLKHKVSNLFMGSNVLSPGIYIQMQDIFKPFHELTLKGIKNGEIKSLDLKSIYQIKFALIGVAIDQATIRNLKGKALEMHIRDSFDIYWRGVGK